MFKNKKNGFYCFSPPVMLATFAIEITLLALLVIKRKLNKPAQLIVATLFFLAFFQLAEYFVCGGLGVNAETWSRLGFIAITTLPPLGIHLIHAISNKKEGPLVWTSYALMSIWIGIYAFMPNAFESHQCVSNYVIFQLNHLLGYAYSAYYYGILLLGIALALRFGEHAKKKSEKDAQFGMIIGYLVFLLPTAIANTLSPETMRGIPSIMCGFAILFALILYFYIASRVTTKK